LHTFSRLNNDGNASYSSLVFDGHGNLFGTTAFGGSGNFCSRGCGTVFELMPAAGGSFHYGVIYEFGATATDGQYAGGGAVVAGEGKVFGTTTGGGPAGGGTVWELSRSQTGWTETVLYNFQGGTDGASPTSTMVFGSRGDLFGTTNNGGNTTACNGGCGTIFHLSHSGSTWTETPPFRFNGANGRVPEDSGLIKDAEGNLYGVTALGGSSNDGTVFKVGP
jgi:uncharacterized repeat protein (TIGR03803 family)